jgi:hypothetical protein
MLTREQMAMRVAQELRDGMAEGGSSPGGTISSTSTTVMRPAVAISGLKFCAVWRPGIYVDRLIVGQFEKRIEQRTLRAGGH